MGDNLTIATSMPSSLAAVFWWSAAAALAAAAGPVLARQRRWLPFSPLGWASALAAGMMIGVAYPLMLAGIAGRASTAAVGALLGIALPYLAHALLGVGTDSDSRRPVHMVAAGAVHGSPEGVAIGAAMAVGPHLGIFLAVTLAVHNVWESAVLADRLRLAGASRSRAAVLGVLTNSTQVLLALASYAVATARPELLPPLLGVAFGALMYLCFAELLPDSYQRAGRTSIALVVSVAAGVVAVIGGSA